MVFGRSRIFTGKLWKTRTLNSELLSTRRPVHQTCHHKRKEKRLTQCIRADDTVVWTFEWYTYRMYWDVICARIWGWWCHLSWRWDMMGCQSNEISWGWNGFPRYHGSGIAASDSLWRKHGFAIPAPNRSGVQHNLSLVARIQFPFINSFRWTRTWEFETANNCHNNSHISTTNCIQPDSLCLICWTPVQNVVSSSTFAPKKKTSWGQRQWLLCLRISCARSDTPLHSTPENPCARYLRCLGNHVWHSLSQHFCSN